MNTWAVGFIVSIVFNILWGLLFYLWKKDDQEKENRIKCLEDKTIEQDLKIQSLQAKLWSETKLEKVINQAVEAQFLKWENRLYKKGLIKE